MSGYFCLRASPKFLQKIFDLTSQPARAIKIYLRKDELNFDFRRGLKELNERIGKLETETIIVDLTPAQMKAQGLSIVKVLIPDFVDLGLGNLYYLGKKRVYALPVKLGYPGKKEEELNVFPHPFP